MRVLLIKTSSMGDIIHTLPAVSDARQALPGIHFDWVVEEGFSEIPAWHPAVTEVIPVALRRWRQQPLNTWRSGQWQAFRQRLQRERYSLVIDAQGLIKSALLSRLLSAPIHGFDRRSIREPLASLCYAHRHRVDWGQHAVERLRQLFSQVLGYTLPASPLGYGLDRTRMRLDNDTPDNATPPYLLFLHATTWPSKHWPEEFWRQLAQRAVAAGWHIRLPWGNDSERQRAERLAHNLPQVCVLPQLNLAGIANQLAGASAGVAVDTGLGHLAAALDVPTVSLFGPTNPDSTGAWGQHQHHLQSPSSPTSSVAAIAPGRRHAAGPATTVPPDQVWQSLQALLAQSGAQQPEEST